MMTSGIPKSIYIKSKLLKNLINKKDSRIKAVFQEQYKTYRKLDSKLMKQSKYICNTRQFENNWNNVKNTLKEIGTIISIKNITAAMPH